MRRKNFLKSIIPVATMPFLIRGHSIRALGQGGLFQKTLTRSATDRRVLVLIQLDGGNDGLSTVIPVDQYPTLHKARKNILIPEKNILSLYNSSVTGLHPALSELRDMYNHKKLSIIQGVGYPDPVFSHFRATDIWHTGSGSSTVLNSGWVGRFLDTQYPQYPKGYPNTDVPDPLAIQVGSTLSNTLLGPSVGMGMAINSTSYFYNFVLGKEVEKLSGNCGNELLFINSIASQTKQYMERIKQAAQKQKKVSTRYAHLGENPLAAQLKIVAQLIGGGLQTKVYIVNLMGFDTHHNQVDPSNAMQGAHAKLLRQLSEAIAAFEDDLQLMGRQDDVLGMTYSEFGRRITSNASYGTDHGSSGPMLLFGTKLKGGLIGVNPTIDSNVSVNDNLPLQHDFRSVYASVLKGWFGISDEKLNDTLLNKYPLLNLFA